MADDAGLELREQAGAAQGAIAVVRGIGGAVVEFGVALAPEAVGADAEGLGQVVGAVEAQRSRDCGTVLRSLGKVAMCCASCFSSLGVNACTWAAMIGLARPMFGLLTV